MTQLETEFEMSPESMGQEGLIKLVQLLRKERDCAENNFTVTNKAYVLLDRQLRETSAVLRDVIDNLQSESRSQNKIGFRFPLRDSEK